MDKIEEMKLEAARKELEKRLQEYQNWENRCWIAKGSPKLDFFVVKACQELVMLHLKLLDIETFLKKAK